MRIRTGFTPILAAFTLAAAHQARATEGYFANGYGTISKGMAGVAYALPTDSLSIASNPASASFLGNRADFDADLFAPQRSASITGNAYGPDQGFNGNKIKIFVIPEAGVIYQLPHNLSAGLAVYGDGGMDTDYGSNPYARFGAKGSAGVDLQTMFISPTLAWKFAPGQSVGVSLDVVDEFFRAHGLGVFSGASESPGNVSNQGEDSAFGYGFRVGYLGQLTPWLAVGASYQSKAYGAGFDRYRGLFAEQGGFNTPATYGAGIDVKPLAGLDTALDVQRIDYRSVESIGDAFQTLLSGVPLGANGGPGFGWKNTTTIKFGANYHLTPAWQVRGGYSYTTEAIPANQTFLNILAPGVVQNQFTLGATYTSHGGVLPTGLELSAYGLYALPQTVHGENSIPTAFGGGNANIKLSEKALGVGIGYMF
ncbi:MAG: OmpP1/FadL family transporter [Acidocella sp.]|uniref:OmpP1/FadL family transporter n=1 Tax=Acidocella sp. TaxID=50710 RepID=UPI003FBC0BB0